MKIGAYELSSQMNIYSRLSSESIKRVDNIAANPEVEKPKRELDVTLQIDGKNSFSPSSSLYSKFPQSGKVLNPSVQKLDDFSLTSAKEDKITSRINKEDNTNLNYKEIISDETMDTFLKDAFKLF
ncbi:MAG: hypothetical protein K5776_11920 [Lachnospiraceae bacterium]|nr:hypothetical protein [Lachnospiraceae bacterium]